jgi:hypothetical protein
MFTRLKQSFRLTVRIFDREHHLMMLPVFSLSMPSDGSQRMVFDWGKSLSHPHADIAFAFLELWGNRIAKVVFKNQSFEIKKISKCRSGRKAAILVPWGPPSSTDLAIIEKLLAVEFPHKTTV